MLPVTKDTHTYKHTHALTYAYIHPCLHLRYKQAKCVDYLCLCVYVHAHKHVWTGSFIAVKMCDCNDDVKIFLFPFTGLCVSQRSPIWCSLSVSLPRYSHCLPAKGRPRAAAVDSDTTGIV